jgi:hypothetical protein
MRTCRRAGAVIEVMRTAVAALAATSLVLALAAPAGIDEGPRPLGTARERGPDGVLVIAALSPERMLVADPGTGRTRERELPGGTLCHGPLLAIGDRVVYLGSRGGRAVALSAPLGRLGRARSLGPAQLIVPSADTGRLWLGRWTDADHLAGRLMLREVDAGGHVTATAGRRLPRWAWLTPRRPVASCSRTTADSSGGRHDSTGRGFSCAAAGWSPPPRTASHRAAVVAAALGSGAVTPASCSSRRAAFASSPAARMRSRRTARGSRSP